MKADTHSSLNALVKQLTEGHDLSTSQMTDLLDSILNIGADELLVVAALVALRTKGETATELAAAARFLRGHMKRMPYENLETLDTCGTGGDDASTFNISTATALVAAAAGVPVVKHGNRAISSRSGSADVLHALGVATEICLEHTRGCLKEVGIAFCYAPYFHPILKQLASVRTRLGVRTLFNFIGPLLNPAESSFQLIGVGQRSLLDPMAEAVASLGTRHTILVCGQDGLDEVTLTGPTIVREVTGEKVVSHQWTPESFDLPACLVSDLHASGPEESASQIKAIFEGHPGPRADIVVANAAVALLAAEKVDSLGAGVALSREVLQKGEALRVLQRLASFSQMANLNQARS
jgi:anthranilate phosphoribosyltransferase